MAAKDLVFRFVGMDAGAGREFDKMAGKSSTLEHAITKLGIGMAATAAGVAVESVRMAAKFQQSMELIHTQAGRSQAAVNQMSKAVLQLAGPTATAPDELAKGLYHLASTGLSTAKSMTALKIAAEGAKMGGADLESVTNALNATIASGIKGSGDFTKAMGALNAVVGSGDMRMQDLAEAMGTGVLAAVKGFGLSLNDVGAALATFGDNNIRGADAATQLRMAVLFMAKPAASAKDALKALHLTQRSLADDMRTGGLGKALTDLHKHLVDTGNTGAKMGQILLDMFGHKAGTGISILEQQFGRFQSKQEEVRRGSKNFASDWSSYTQTFGYSWDRFRSAIEATAITLGTKLLPTATKALNWLGTTGVSDLDKFSGWVSRNKGPIEDVAKALGAIAAVRIGSKAFSGLTSLILHPLGGGKAGGALGAAASLEKPLPVFVTNAGFGSKGLPGTGPIKTAEKDAEKYGPAAVPWLAKLATRVGPKVLGGTALAAGITIATMHDPKNGEADIRTAQSSPDVMNRYKQLLAQYEKTHPAATLDIRSAQIQDKLIRQAIADVKRYGEAVRNSANDIETGKSALARLHASLANQHDAVAGMLSSLRTIPGAMGQIAGQMKAAGMNIGAMLDAGMTIAIRQNAGTVNLVTKQMVDGVIQTASKRAQLGSPSKRTIYIGRMLAQGLSVGMLAEAGRVTGSAKKVIDKLIGQFNTVRGNALGMRSGISDNLVGGASLSNMPLTSGTTAFGNSYTAAPTAGGINRFLAGYASQERAFGRNLGLARKHGLSAGEAANIAQLGLDVGGPIAAALAHATRGQIAATNRYESQITATANSIATRAAGDVYGPRIERLLIEIRNELKVAPHKTGHEVKHAMTSPSSARTLATSTTRARRAK